MNASTPLADRSARRRLFAAAAMATFVFGMLIAMLGTLFGMPAMRTRLGLDMARQGDLFGVMFTGLLVAAAFVGPLIDRFGSKPVMLSASTMVTAGLAALALARGFGGAAAAALLLGVGGGWLNTASNALVSDVYHDDRGRMLNLLGTFFGLGALFVPLIVLAGFEALSAVLGVSAYSPELGFGPVAGLLGVFAAVAGASAVACGTVSFPPAHEGTKFSFSGMVDAAKSPGVALLAALLLFEAGNEAVLSGYTATYVYVTSGSPGAGTVVVFGYWVVAILGRVASARVQARTGKAPLVVGSSVLVVTGCVLLLASGAWLPGLVAGAWIASLGMAAIFPTMLAIAGDRYQRFAGTVFGVLFTVGNLGSIFFPWATGHVSQPAGLRLGMIVPLVGAIAVMGLAGVIAARVNRD
jgi:MFS transporter, FHS family, glucose/mannose:H+ symporter